VYTAPQGCQVAPFNQNVQNLHTAIGQETKLKTDSPSRDIFYQISSSIIGHTQTMRVKYTHYTVHQGHAGAMERVPVNGGWVGNWGLGL
jgi:hypothetical protein